jgi:ABC-type bacteriocin/lantibiotic exporter with double-glycine peptidase domain
LEGSFAYLPRENFFTTESVKENISFYDSNISSEQIKAVYHILDLDEDLSMRGGLDEKVRMDSFSEI